MRGKSKIIDFFLIFRKGFICFFRKRFRYIIQFLLFIALVLITALLFNYLNKELSRRMDRLKVEIIEHLELQLGRKVSYKSLAPSIFMFLEIRDLLIYSGLEEEDEIFRINKIRISYNIFKLITTTDILSCISSLEVANTLFQINLDRYTAESPAGGTGEDSPELQIDVLLKLLRSSYNFNIKGKNVDLFLNSGEMELKFTALFFDIADDAGDFNLTVNKGLLSIRAPREKDSEFRLSSKFKLNGVVENNLTYSDLFVNILYLSSSYINMEKQTFQITYQNNQVEVRKIQDKAAIDIQVLFNRPEQEVTVNFNTDDFKPNEIVRFTGPLYEFNKLLETKVTSTGTVSHVLGSSEINYNIDADFYLSTRVFPIESHINTKLNGNLKKINFDKLHVKTGLGSFDFVGNLLVENWYPEGFVELINVKALPGKALNAAFNIIRNNKSINLRGSKLVLGSSGFDLFNMDLYPGDKAIIFSLEASIANVIKDDLIRAFGFLSLGDKIALNVSGNLFDIPVSAFYKLFVPSGDFTGEMFDSLSGYTVSADFEAETDFKHYTAKSGYLLLSDISEINNYLHCAIDARDNSFLIGDIKSQWTDYHVEGDIKGHIDAAGMLDCDASLKVQDIPYSLSLSYVPGERIEWEGKYGLRGRVSMYKSRTFDFSLGATYFPVPLMGSNPRIIYFTSDMTGSISPDLEWNIISRESILYDIPIISVKHNSIAFSCRGDKDGIVMKDLVYKDRTSTVSGNGRLDFLESGEFGVTLSLLLNHEKTDETYDMVLTLEEDRIDSLIRFNSAPIERLGDLFITGTASGSAKLKGLLSRPDMFVKFQTDRAKISSDLVTLSGEIDITGPGIIVHSFNLGYMDHVFFNSGGSLDFESGNFLINTDYRFNFFNKNVSADVIFQGIFYDIDKSKYFDSLALNNFIINIKFLNILVDDEKFDPWSVNINRTVDDIALKGGPGDVLTAQVNLSGEFYLQISDPFPIRISVEGEVLDREIKALIRDIWLDLKVFNLVLGEDIFRFTNGYAAGNNVYISGTINDPDYDGSIRVNDARIAFFLIPDETESFNSNLLFEEKNISIKNVRADIGEGAILCNGLFLVDHWVPQAYDLFFQTDRSIGTHIKSSFGAVKVDGYSTGYLNAKGNAYDIWVDGELTANHFKLEMQDEVIVEESKDSVNLHIDLKFITGVNSEFYWPSVTFPVLNCYASQGSEIKLSFESENKEMTLEGKVDIQGGQMYWFDRNFHLQSGFIVFNEKGGEFDPRLTAEATRKEIDEEGDDVVIIMKFLNNRLSEFSPIWDSTPSKPKQEVLALLGGSIREKFEEGGIDVGGIALLSDMLSQFMIFRPLEDRVRKSLNLDIFSIRTPIVQNILQDRLVEDDPFNPDGGNILGKYFDDTTIQIGKYLGSDLFIKGLLRIRDAEKVSDEEIPSLDFMGLVPEVEISIEWPTPLFNLEWSINPKNYQEFFLPDNSLKIEWSISYK